MPESIAARSIKLEDKLLAFARRSTERRESDLKKFIFDVRRLTDMQTLRQLVLLNPRRIGFSARIMQAAQNTMRTPLNTSDGLVRDWTKSYAISALDSHGHFLGFDATRDSERVLKYTVSKALFSMVLDDPKHPNPGVMSDPRNFAFLERLGVKRNVELYIGGYGPVKVGNTVIYFGASEGSAPNRAYVASIIHGEPEDRNTVAGAIEEQFAKITSFYINNPDAPILPQEETTLIRSIRLAH